MHSTVPARLPVDRAACYNWSVMYRTGNGRFWRPFIGLDPARSDCSLSDLLLWEQGGLRPVRGDHPQQPCVCDNTAAKTLLQVYDVATARVAQSNCNPPTLTPTTASTVQLPQHALTGMEEGRHRSQNC